MIVPVHAYAVYGYNPRERRVYIHNPWMDGDYVYGKFFSLSLQDFCEQFDELDVEKR